MEQFVADPKDVAYLVGHGMTLFVSPLGVVKLLSDPRDVIRKPNLHVSCSFDACLNAMGHHADLTERSTQHKVGWRDMGHTEEGRYIKFLM